MNAALDVACYIIEKSRYTKTHLQVQKLVYISHGFMLAIHDRPLFFDDVEAWSRGPAIPSIYGAFERWGSDVIGNTPPPPPPPPAATSSSPCTPPPPPPPPKQFDDEERKVIDSVYENYDKFSGYRLSDIARNTGGELDTPWAQCYESGGENTVIDNGLIKQYYKLLLNVGV